MTRRKKKQKQAKSYNSLYLIPLVFAPCAVFTALAQISQEGATFRYLFPISVAAIWAFAAIYSVLLKRSFMADASVLLILPFGLLVQLARGMVGLGGAAKWMVKLATLSFGTHNPLERENKIPYALNTLKGHGHVMRRLNRMQSAVLGRNTERVLFCNWLDAKHILIQGTTGTGKTTVALTMILSMLMVGPAIFSKWRFKIHDAKHIIGTWFLNIARAYPEKFKVVMEFEDALAEAEELYKEMRERLQIIGEAGMEPEDADLDRILYLCDEPQVWYAEGKEGKRYQWLVSNLVNLGRQAGIHVVLITPYALAKVIDTEYRGNLRIITGYMKKNSIPSHGIAAVVELRKHQFLYEEDPVQAEVFFETYAVGRQDLDWIVEVLLEESVVSETGAIDPRELAVHIFSNTPECGIRTIQKIGLQHCQALLENSQIDAVPFPWSQIRIEDGVPKPSKKANVWTRDILDQMVEAGIAENTGQGKAKRFIGGNPTNAIALWREYSLQKPSVGL
jgi:hypothetical protein